MNYLKSTALLVPVFLFYSCEYEPPEKTTYVDSESSPPILSNQTLDLNSDTLYVWNGKTSFSFDLTSTGQSVIGVVIEFNETSKTIEGSHGSFEIDPSQYQAGIYALRMNVYTHSGTGSLADMIGGETYLFSKEWTLKIEKNINVKRAFISMIENGFLKFQWQAFEKPYLNYYKIIGSDSALSYSFTNTIKSNSTSFIDSSFIGGKLSVRLLLGLKKGDGTTMEYEAGQLTYRFPVRFTFTENCDSLKIKWTDIPFRHKCYMYSSKISIGNAKYYTIKSPGLGNPISYQFSIEPEIKVPGHSPFNNMYTMYPSYVLGNMVDMKFSRILYIPHINTYILKDESFVRTNDGSTLLRVLTNDHSYDYYDNSTISLSPDNSKVFTTVDQNILQLNSSTFKMVDKRIFTPSTNTNKTFSFMQVIDDSLMYIAYNGHLAIYNFNLAKIDDVVSISNSNGAPYNISASKDNIYVANCGGGVLKMFRRTSLNKFEEIYNVAGNFLECIFDPVNSENLLIVTSEKTYFLRCPEMELVSEIPSTIKGYVVNFDPVTNYLLFVSSVYKTITVYDYQHDIVKFKCNHHSDYRYFYLANNNIFFSEGTYLNINNFDK